MDSGFNASETHEVSIVNTSPELQLVLDYAIVTVPSTSSYLLVLPPFKWTI